MCRRVLDKYVIGTIHSNAAKSVKTVHYEDDTGEGEFYNVLQRRVEKYFRGNEVRVCLDELPDSACNCQAPAQSFRLFLEHVVLLWNYDKASLGATVARPCSWLCRSIPGPPGHGV